MNDKKKAWLRSIKTKVIVENEDRLIERSKKRAKGSEERIDRIMSKHQKRIRKDELVKKCFRLCRIMKINIEVLAVDLGLKSYIKGNKLDDLELLAATLQDRFKLFESEK